MVNNIEIIRNNLKFDKFGEFYYISIIQRSKDGILVKGAHDNARRIRTFYVFSLDEFDRVIPFITEICDKLGARAYIEMNRKNIFKCQLECIKRLLEGIEHQTLKSRTLMDSVVAAAPSRDKLWLIDVDAPEALEEAVNYIEKKKATYYIIPSVNGKHIITSRFDPREWYFENAEIKRNAFTLLYYNDISSKQE